jgi:hypothetical protein
MRVMDLLARGAGVIIGIILGIAGFLYLYLPLKANLGLGIAGSQGPGGEGPIVPMGRLIPFYLLAGGAIDLIVLLAFAIAGAYVVLGILGSPKGKR